MAQTILMYMFYIISLIGVLTLLYVRKIDARTVFFVGTLVYGLPLYFGYLEYRLSYLNGGLMYHDNIVNEIYIIYILLVFVYLLSLIKITKKNSLGSDDINKPIKKFIDYEVFLIALNFSLLISASLFIFTTGLETFTMDDRGEKLNNYTVWYYFSGTISVITTILNILLRKDWKYYVLPIGYLLFDLIMGDRTFLFLGIVSFAVCYLHSKEINLNIKTRLKIGSVLILALVSAFVYKPFYFAISQGYFKVEDIGEYLNRAIIGSEPFIIMGNLNEIIKYGGITLESSYIINSIIGHLPFYETVTNNSREGFNSLFQDILFPFTEWGLASTAFGELYSIGGMVAIIIYLAFIYFFLKFPVPRNNIGKMLYFFIVPYLLFYFHRTDWTYFIGMIRYFAFSFILIIPIYLFLYLVKNGAKKSKQII